MPPYRKPKTYDLKDMVSRVLFHPLADLYNRCIESCDWPLRWKKSDWVQVFKEDNKQDIKNYRPVTALIAIGKVFKQLLSKQLKSFIDRIVSNNLTAYQIKGSELRNFPYWMGRKMETGR